MKSPGEMARLQAFDDLLARGKPATAPAPAMRPWTKPPRRTT